MSALTLGMLAGGLAMAIAGALVFTWAARSGQFDDLEEVKFRMLREGNEREHYDPES